MSGSAFTFTIDGVETVWDDGVCDADFALAGAGVAPTKKYLGFDSQVR